MSVNTNKPLHVSVLFIGLSYAMLCAITIMSSADLQRKSAEEIIVMAQSTAYGPLRIAQ
jgi:hypothetical protein